MDHQKELQLITVSLWPHDKRVVENVKPYGALITEQVGETYCQTSCSMHPQTKQPQFIYSLPEYKAHSKKNCQPKHYLVHE